MLVAIASLYVGYTHRNWNFHVVETGRVYRAGRMSNDALSDTVKAYGIRSVLNLEGDKPRKDWYRRELATLEALGVAHYDFKLSATTAVPPGRVAELLQLMRDAPKPLLVHCRDGGDRTGLAAALYQAKIEGIDEDEAYKQLSLVDGHFRYLGSGTERMDETYWTFVDPARGRERGIDTTRK